MRLLEPFVRYKATKIFNNQEWSSPGNVTDGRFGMGHPSNTKWHWPRPINTPNCNSIRPVVFAQGSGDLASQHICELSSNHEHSLWLWQTNRHDDEKHAAQLKLCSIKMNRPINSGKRVDGVDQFSTQSSRSTESTKVESINYQSSRDDLFDWIDFKVYKKLNRLRCANSRPRSCINGPVRFLNQHEWISDRCSAPNCTYHYAFQYQ